VAPALKPIRERIERAVASRLATIAESETYWFTLGAARIRRSPLKLDQFKFDPGPLAILLAQGPILTVARGSGAEYNPDYSQTSDQHSHRFAVWGYVVGEMDTDANLAGDLINRLWDDHRIALLVDRTLGGVAKSLKPDGPMDTDDGEIEPFALFRQHWLAIT